MVSSILVKALEADYWKPVQSGDLDNTDTMKVKAWAGSRSSVFHQETYRLNTPASPHLSARLDGVEISLESFAVPDTENHLVVEGAGGLMVPLNEKGDFILDILKMVSSKVVLVSRNYLGSINHTLSSFEVLKSRGLGVDLLVFSGEENASSEEVICGYVKPAAVLRVPRFESVDEHSVGQFSLENKNRITSALG